MITQQVPEPITQWHYHRPGIQAKFYEKNELST